MDAQTSNKNLLRVLTLSDAVGVGLGAIIGAGIFVVTGVAAGISGPAFLIGLMIAGTIAVFNALSSAQLAVVYPFSGGTYEYGYRLLKPAYGFAAGWMFLVSKLSAAGVVAIGFGHYFHQLVPVANPMTISLFAILLLTLANYYGVKKAGKMNGVIVLITLLSLLYLVLSGLPEVKAQNFRPFSPYGNAAISEASALLFFAFTGYARIATLAEEVTHPEKTIPRAILITLFCALVLYAGVSIVAVGVIGTHKMAESVSPLQKVAASLQSPYILLIITIGASTAMLGVLLSQIMGISRMMLAMGRRKDLPPLFMSVHGKYQIPHLGIMITGAIIMFLCIMGSFEFILGSATFTILLYYSITNMAAFRQPKKEQRYSRLIPILGLGGCFAMSLSLPYEVIVTGLAWLIGGFILRYFIHLKYDD